MKIAWELGKTLDEIELMPLPEFEMWGAFFQIVNDERKRAVQEARRGH